MTRYSFSEALEQLEPHTVTASHYSLAPDAYGLDDGYAWAFGSDEFGNLTRDHLADGGEWPYYIAAKPKRAADRYTAATPVDRRDDVLTRDGEPVPYPGDVNRAKGDTVNDALREGRILETYCEGDLTAYVFESHEDRDAAATAWGETPAEYVARVIEEDHPEHHGGNVGEAFADAVLSEASEGYGRDAVTRERIADVMEGYAGEWDSPGDFWEEFAADTTPSEVWEAMGDLRMYIDWEKYARDRDTEGDVNFHGRYAFRAV